MQRDPRGARTQEPQGTITWTGGRRSSTSRTRFGAARAARESSASFELWTELPAPVGAMRATLR
ncbi:MAG: hypothetical protein H0T20_02555 [Actinobacteria bacterium]|nr:hypothetical protein [Actinomycetota bacterium]